MGIEGIVQQIAVQDIERRDDLPVIGENWIPNTNEPGLDGLDAGDAADINGPSGSPPPPPPGPGGSDDPNYVENSTQYNDEVNGAGNGGAVDNAGDALNNSGDAISDIFNNLDDDDFIWEEDGMLYMDGEALAKLMMFLNLLINAEMGLQLLLDAMGEMSAKWREIILEIPRDENDQIDRSQFFKNKKEILKIFEKFVTALFQRVFNHNLEELKNDIKKAKKKKKNGNKFTNWFDNHLAIDFEKDKNKAYAKFNEAMKHNLHALMSALRVLGIVYANSDNPAVQGLGNALDAFLDRLDEVCSMLDVNVSAGSDYFDEDDIRNLFQDILFDFRAPMVAIENNFKAMLFLLTAQQDLSASIRETALEISAHSSKAEYAYVSYEGFAKSANIFFDLTYNTLMSRVKFHNDQVQIKKNIKKLEKAKGLQIFGRILTVIAIVIAIVICIIISVVTWGGAAGPSAAVMAALVGAAAGAGVAGGVMTGVGIARADRIVSDSFDANPADYTFNLLVNRKKSGNNAADALNDIEKAEQLLAEYMANVNFLEKTKDGFYVFNTQAFAAYELRQRSLQNIGKLIVNIAKAQRDLSRSVVSIALEKAVKDHGEGYLLGCLQSSFTQRQLLMGAIKFQVQQKVMEKNIKRQKALRAEAALWSSLSGVIGAAAGVALYVTPLGWAAVGIGAALGTAIYGIYDAFKPDGAYKMTCDISSDEFNKYLDARKNNGKTGTPEDKIAQMEDQLMADLLGPLGTVGIGDGYKGVNYGLVGKVYAGLMKLQMLRQMLAKIRAAKMKISAAVRQGAQGVGTAGPDLASGQAQHSFSQAMTAVAAIVQFLSDKVAIQNRARDAKKQAVKAGVCGGINVALAAVGGGVGIANPAGNFATVFAEFSRGITAGLMNLVNGIGAVSSSVASAQSDHGYYNGYDQEATVKNIRGDKVNQEDDMYAKLAGLEEQIYMELGKNLAQTLHGGSSVVNGENTAILSDRLSTINNIKEMLLTIAAGQAKLSANVRRKTGMVTSGAEDFTGFVSVQKQVSQKILNSLVQAQETIAQRNNQIDQATRQSWVSGISTAFSLASVCLSAGASIHKVEASSAYNKLTNDSSQPVGAATDPSVTSGAGAESAPVAPTTEVADAEAGDKGGKDKAGESKESNKGDSAGTSTSSTGSAAAGNAGAAGSEVGAADGDEAEVVKTTNAKGQKNKAAKEKEDEKNSLNGRPESGEEPTGNVSQQGKAKPAKAHRDAYESHTKSKLKLSAWSAGLNLASILSTYAAGEIYDKANDGKESKISQSGLDSKNDAPNSEAKGVFSSIDRSEAMTAQSEIAIAGYSTPDSLEILAQQSAQMIQMIMDSIEASANLTGDIAQATGAGYDAFYGDIDQFAEQGAVPLNANLSDTPASTTAKLIIESANPVKDVQTIIAKAESGDISRDKANQILGKVKSADPDSFAANKGMVNTTFATIDAYSEAQNNAQAQTAAAGAAVQPNQVQAPQDAAKPLEVDKPKTSNSKGALDRADQISKKIQAKMDRLDEIQKKDMPKAKKDLETVKRELTEIETMLAKLDELYVAKVADAVNNPNVDLDALLADLHAKRAELGEKKTKAEDKVKKLETEMSKLNDDLSKLDAQKTNALKHVKRRQDEIKKEVEALRSEHGKLEKTEKALMSEQAQLRAKLEDPNLTDSQKAKLKADLQKLAGKLKKVSGEKKAIGEKQKVLKGDNKHLGQVAKDLDADMAALKVKKVKVQAEVKKARGELTQVSKTLTKIDATIIEIQANINADKKKDNEKKVAAKNDQKNMAKEKETYGKQAYRAQEEQKLFEDQARKGVFSVG